MVHSFVFGKPSGLQARTTLNNSSLFDIITVVVFALSPFLYSRDNEAVQKLNGSRQVDCKSYMRSCYHIIPEKMICAVLDVCRGGATSSIMGGTK